MSWLRYALGDKSVRASTLLGSWARIPDLVSEQDIVNLIKNGGVLPVAAQPIAADAGVVSDKSDSDVEIVAGPSSSRTAVARA